MNTLQMTPAPIYGWTAANRWETSADDLELGADGQAYNGLVRLETLHVVATVHRRSDVG
jgi:hypothetical protein